MPKCEICGREISEEEYEANGGTCNQCSLEDDAIATIM